MITEFRENRIKEIAKAQLLAWRKAFSGILSEALLSKLLLEDFEENWKTILTQKERKNFIWVNEMDEGVGFVSYGSPKDSAEQADIEIYGIYVHPDHWAKAIGYQLMEYAVNTIRETSPSARIILWTMHDNQRSQKFYHRFGFRKNGKSRQSSRNNETFEEIQFEIQ